MVGVPDMCNQSGKRLGLPIATASRRLGFLSRRSKRIDYLVYRQIGRLAGLLEGFAPAAAIIDPQLLEDPGRGREFQRQIAHRFFCHHAHRFLL